MTWKRKLEPSSPMPTVHFPLYNMRPSGVDSTWPGKESWNHLPPCQLYTSHYVYNCMPRGIDSTWPGKESWNHPPPCQLYTSHYITCGPVELTPHGQEKKAGTIFPHANCTLLCTVYVLYSIHPLKTARQRLPPLAHIKQTQFSKNVLYV